MTKQRIEEITVTVGEVTRDFQVIAADARPVRPGRYKFCVKVKKAGMWNNLGFFQTASFELAAQMAFHMHY
jgi:hypothetical protein